MGSNLDKIRAFVTGETLQLRGVRTEEKVLTVFICWGRPAALMSGFEPGRHLGTERKEGIQAG